MRKNFVLACQLVLACSLVVAIAGCPRPLADPAKVFVLVTADNSFGAKAYKAELPVEDIESLTVTVTEISLVPTEDVEEEDPVEGGEPEAKASSHPVLFEGSMDVNLLDLTDVSAVLSSAEVEPGTYGQIRLEIENPRLVLKAEPEEVVTDIQLTANGRLFITGEFEIPEGGSQLLVLSFGGIHLVETGNGKLVLTPQLQASLEVSSADALVIGAITALDTEADTLEVTLADGTVVSAAYAGATVFLPADTDTPTGTELDLAVGLEVEVQGLFDVEGAVTAQSIRIYPVEPPQP